MQCSYKAIVQPAETGGYEAVMTGWPNGSANGSTKDEAITNLRNQLARDLVSSQPDYCNSPSEDHLPGVTYPPELSYSRVQALLNAMVTTDGVPVLNKETNEWFPQLVDNLRHRPQMMMFYRNYRSKSFGYDAIANYFIGFERAVYYYKKEPVLDLFNELVQQRLDGGRSVGWCGQIWAAACEDDEKTITLLFDLLEEYIRADWLEPGSTIVQFECPID